MKPRAIQRSRAKGTRLPANTVCATRPLRWGNYSADGSNANYAVAAYRHDLMRGLAGKDRNLSVDDCRRELRGKNIACWCGLGDPCHRSVLLDIANS